MKAEVTPEGLIRLSPDNGADAFVLKRFLHPSAPRVASSRLASPGARLLDVYFEPVADQARILVHIWMRFQDDPYYANEVDGDPHCRFCDAWKVDGHDDDCPWLAMKKVYSNA